jgi:hypothetical protein
MKVATSMLYCALGTTFVAVETAAARRQTQAGGCADLSGDGSVDVTDLLTLLAGFGGSDAGSDVNEDGSTDVTDLLLLLGQFGTSCSSDPAQGTDGWSPWTLATPGALAGIADGATLQYKYTGKANGGYYMTPVTELVWDWDSYQSLDGDYTYKKSSGGDEDTFACGHVEQGHLGIGCSNGGGNQWKVFTWMPVCPAQPTPISALSRTREGPPTPTLTPSRAILCASQVGHSFRDSKNPAAAETMVCQDQPDAFGVGACGIGVIYFRQQASAEFFGNDLVCLPPPPSSSHGPYTIVAILLQAAPFHQR